MTRPSDWTADPCYHRATERLLQSLHQLVLCLDGEIEASIPFGEASRFEDALLTRPGVAFHT